MALAFSLFQGECRLYAFDELPWFGNYYEMVLQNEGLVQLFPCVAEGGKDKKYAANDLFLQARLSSALPDPNIEVAAAACLGWTRKQSGNIDHLQLGLKKLWLDDVAGDGLSLTTSINYIQAFKQSLKDVSSFHHGLYHCLLGVSLGKEIAEGFNWKHREWLYVGFGWAERGSPWLSFKARAERRLRENQTASLFLEGLYGLGGRQLHLSHFKGYGALAHRSLDLGMAYLYEIEYVGSISAQYTYRVYSENFPAKTSCLLVELLCTFGL